MAKNGRRKPSGIKKFNGLRVQRIKGFNLYGV